MRVGLRSSVNKLRDLIGALRECSAKATLRGIEIAAEVHADEKTRSDSLARMSRIVRIWREDDPLTKLQAELDHLQGGDDSPPQPS
jgi:hypothetical protein